MSTTLTSSTATSTQRLTTSEAEGLWRNWKEQRDSRSRDQLVLAYAPMVRYIASRKVRELPAHCELDDLASSGLVALMEAIDRFDPDEGRELRAVRMDARRRRPRRRAAQAGLGLALGPA